MADDLSLPGDGSAFPSSMRPTPLFMPIDASNASSTTTTAFSPLAATTPGKPSFKPRLALQLVSEDTTSSTTSIDPTAASQSSPPSPTAAGAAGVNDAPRTASSRSAAVAASRTTNTTFREDQFEIRHSSFTSTSRRASQITATTTSQLTSASASASASPSTASSPASSTPSTPPQQLLALSSTTLTTLSVLGRGASATVLKCRHLPTGRLIALKCIDISSHSNRSQLVKELRQYDSTTYTSPFFVEWYGAYYEANQVRIGLEYCDRGGLDAVLKRYMPKGVQSEALIANIMHQSLLALNQLHSNHKIHRDIKPGNFLLKCSGTVKCADFGLLAQLESTLAQRQTFTGTVLYMSPERLSSEEYGVGADVWSLGMTALVLDGGKHPLEAVMRDGGYFAVMAEVAGRNTTDDEKAEEEDGGETSEDDSKRVRPVKRRWEDELSPGRSEQMHDFIRCCLNPDPAQRHTTTQLLTHPFITSAPDNTAALSLWPTDMRMGEVEAEAAAVAEESGDGTGASVAAGVGVGEWARREGGREWIRQSLIGNARKERDRRKAAGGGGGGDDGVVVLSPPDDLSSLQSDVVQVL